MKDNSQEYELGIIEGAYERALSASHRVGPDHEIVLIEKSSVLISPAPFTYSRVLSNNGLYISQSLTIYRNKWKKQYNWNPDNVDFYKLMSLNHGPKGHFC